MIDDEFDDVGEWWPNADGVVCPDNKLWLDVNTRLFMFLVKFLRSKVRSDELCTGDTCSDLDLCAES